MEITEKSAITAWKSALRKVYADGSDYIDVNRRQCRQLLNLMIRITNPSKDITSPIKKLNLLGKIIYPGLDEIREVILSKTVSPSYYYSYGPRLFNFNSQVNQIDNFVIPTLKEQQGSRRATAILFNPLKDSRIHNKEVPGLIMIDFKVHNDRLNVTSFIRSNDMYYGWPANIYQLSILQEYVSDRVGCRSGELTTVSGSAHIFKEHFKDILNLLDN